MNKPNTDSKPKTVGWDNINWQQVDRYVFKLQKRIYAASRRGKIKQVRKLQKTLIDLLRKYNGNVRLRSAHWQSQSPLIE